MPELVIKGGTVVDRAGERRSDIVVDDGGCIAAIGPDLNAGSVLDAEGCVVTSGLVDLRARLGEPGNEQAETIESATRSAALGGYTAIVAMPDSDPVVDSAAVLRDLQRLAQDALCHVAIAGAITVGCAGEQLAAIAEMASLGVRMISDAGHAIGDARLLRRAMEYAGDRDLTLSLHCEDAALASGGHMHEGAVSSLLGIAGIPAEAEELAVMRAITLGRLTGARVHLQGLSTGGSAGIIRASKTQGLAVTCDVVMPNLVLTDAAVATYDARFKLAPPLRPAAEVALLRAALADGAVDAIASDHTPWEPHLKELPFDEAPVGVVGFETTLALALTELDLPLARILELLSWRPAAIAGLDDTHGGTLSIGRPANLAVIDQATEWVVHGDAFASRSVQSPFEGRRVRGRVRHTLVDGEAVVIDGLAQR